MTWLDAFGLAVLLTFGGLFLLAGAILTCTNRRASSVFITLFGALILYMAANP